MECETTTRRLVVRPYRRGDYRAWVQYWQTMLAPQNLWDISAMKKNRDLSPKAFREMLAVQKDRRARDFFYDFVAFRKSDGQIVGALSLMDVSRGVFQSAYLGYSMSNLYWGKGYGKEAVKACVKLGFTDLRLHRIEAGIEPGNKRSAALAKSIGMRREGRKVRSLYLRNKWVDLMVYALTCEDLGLKFRGPAPKHF